MTCRPSASNTRRLLANSSVMRPFGRPAHLAVVHPELPLVLRHLDLGLGKRLAVVGHQQAVHVVGVEMRDHHHVDRAAVDAGRGEIGVERAALALALRRRRLAVAGVEQHALAAGRQHDRRIGVLHLVGRLARRRERLLQIVGARVAQVVAVHRHHAETVGQHGHFDVANLVAMHVSQPRQSSFMKKAAQNGRPFRSIASPRSRAPGSTAPARGDSRCRPSRPSRAAGTGSDSPRRASSPPTAMS